jgi:hypothetical protein
MPATRPSKGRSSTGLSASYRGKSGASAPRQGPKKMEASPAGTAETPREFETKPIGSIATRPCKRAQEPTLSAAEGTGHPPRKVAQPPVPLLSDLKVWDLRDREIDNLISAWRVDDIKRAVDEPDPAQRN